MYKMLRRTTIQIEKDTLDRLKLFRKIKDGYIETYNDILMRLMTTYEDYVKIMESKSEEDDK